MFPLDPNAPKSPPREIGRQKRDLYDWLMFVIGFAGVVGVVATIVVTLINNASNSADTAKAIDRMSLIANSMAAERPAIESQAVSAADSAKAARDSAEAAKGQTNAILAQAQALISSANATVKSTSAQMIAAQAQSDAATAISATSIPVARFGGLQMTNIDTAPNKAGLVVFKIRPFFLNIGNVGLIPGATSPHLLFAAKLPKSPIVQNEIVFGGNDLTVRPGLGFGPAEDQQMSVELVKRDELIKRKLRAYVWGYTKYTGPTGGKSFTECFLAEVYPDKDKWDQASVHRFNDPAYLCE